MTLEYTAPKYGSDGFNCPHCDAFSHHIWHPIVIPVIVGRSYEAIPGFEIAVCVRCRKISIWLSTSEKHLVVYPLTTKAPPPESNMPDNIKSDYNEARNISALSPESALVLLRRCLEKICDKQKITDENLFNRIDKLIEKEGLDDKTRKALDIVRLVGNDVAHSTGKKYSEEETVPIFKIMNYISTHIYASQAMIDEASDNRVNNK